MSSTSSQFSTSLESISLRVSIKINPKIFHKFLENIRQPYDNINYDLRAKLCERSWKICSFHPPFAGKILEYGRKGRSAVSHENVDSINGLRTSRIYLFGTKIPFVFHRTGNLECLKHALSQDTYNTSISFRSEKRNHLFFVEPFYPLFSWHIVDNLWRGLAM